MSPSAEGQPLEGMPNPTPSEAGRGPEHRPAAGAQTGRGSTRRIALRPSERRLAWLTGIVVGSVAFVSWVVQPLWDRVAGSQEHVTARQQKLDAIGRLFQTAPELMRRYEGLAGYLAPAETEEAQGLLLSQLERLASETHVQINFKPRSVKHEEHLTRIGMELDVEGEPNAVLGFVDEVFRLPKLLTMERLRLAAMPGKTAELRANLVVWQLLLRP